MTSFVRQSVTGLPEHVVLKWSADVLSEGFVPFPKRLLRCLSSVLGGPAAMEHLRVILAAADLRMPRRRPPSLDLLAFLAGMERVEFRAHLNQLCVDGLVKIVGSDDALEVDMEPLLRRITIETAQEDRNHRAL